MMLEFPMQIPSQHAHGNQSKQAQKYLIENLNAIGHTSILNKYNIEPVGNMDGFSEAKMSFNSYLDYLINNQDSHDEDDGNTAVG